MRVTAQLALSQVKLNKKRTVGSVFAIALSTALMTTVMCFVTSGNQMLVDLLGPGYGDYGGAYTVMLLIPALILGLLIAFMSVTVISNIFAASANKRIGEFGVLRCVGGTRKQMKETVIFESLWLSIVGIPLGLLLGVCMGYAGVTITGRFVNRLNEISRSVIMRPISFSLSFHVSGWTFVIAAICSFGIVLWSAGKPAKKAGKITAIQCIRGLVATDRIKNSKVKSGVSDLIFGVEGTLAHKNVIRNKSSYHPTIRALALGIVLLLMVAGLSKQAGEIEAYMDPNSEEMMVDYCSAREERINPVTGEEEERIITPIPAETYQAITDRLSEYEGVEVYGVGSDSGTYDMIPDPRILTEQMFEIPDLTDENGQIDVSLLAVDEKLYEKLCRRAGAPYGSNLLINSFSYNDDGVLRTVTPVKNDVAEISLCTAAGENISFAVGGFLQEEDVSEHGFHDVLPNPIRMIVPNITARFFDWYCEPEDEEAYTTFARAVMDEYYPLLTEDSYVEQGYTVRISRADTLSKMLNISIVLAQVVMYGFVVLLLLMGFASVISTLTTNIRIRGREFAVLQSVGMTRRELEKMLYCESIICIGRASVFGIVFGILIPYLINLSIRKVFPVRYEVPWAMIIFGGIGFVLIVLLITASEIRKQKDTSIIDQIRMDVM